MRKPIAGTQTNLLRLHVDDDDVVWFGHDDLSGHCSHLSSDEFMFVAGDRFDLPIDTMNVRLIGCAANAKLILQLRHRWAAKPAVRQGAKTFIVNPMLSACCHDDPAGILGALWQPSLGDFLPGYWHELSESECVAYALVDAMRESGGIVDGRVRRLIKHHPAWKALSFLGTCDETAACRFLAEIVDPRWFQHPSRPGRISRLSSYVGICPANIKAKLDARRGGRNFGRFVNFLSVWYRPSATPIDYTDPRNFLWRILKAGPDLPRGLKKASMRLLRFMVAVWDGVHVLEEGDGIRSAFVFRIFFGSQGLSSARRFSLKKV